MNALMSDFHAICDFGGRFAGSDGEAAACDWLEARLEQVSGVVPSRSSVDYAGWSRREAVLERIDGAGGTHDCISLVQSPPTRSDGLEADLVDIGRGTEADFDAAGAAVDGNIVLVRHEYMFAADTVHRGRNHLPGRDRRQSRHRGQRSLDVGRQGTDDRRVWCDPGVRRLPYEHQQDTERCQCGTQCSHSRLTLYDSSFGKSPSSSKVLLIRNLFTE